MGDGEKLFPVPFYFELDCDLAAVRLWSVAFPNRVESSNRPSWSIRVCLLLLTPFKFHLNNKPFSFLFLFYVSMLQWSIVLDVLYAVWIFFLSFFPFFIFAYASICDWSLILCIFDNLINNDGFFNFLCMLCV